MSINVIEVLTNRHFKPSALNVIAVVAYDRWSLPRVSDDSDLNGNNFSILGSGRLYAREEVAKGGLDCIFLVQITFSLQLFLT